MARSLDYLEFELEHGRPPRADELTLEQRANLLQCLLERIQGTAVRQIQHEVCTQIVEDPSLFNDLIRALDPEQGAALRKAALSVGYEDLAQKVLDTLGDPDQGPYLEDFIEQMIAVGIPRRPAPG